MPLTSRHRRLRVGEKFLHWTDAVPTQDHMLTWLTLYWLTKSYASSIFYYRDPSESMNVTIPPGPGATDPSIDLEGLFVDKPLGYSKFPMELKVTPEHWAQRTGNLVFFKEHSAGQFGSWQAWQETRVLVR